MQRVRKALWVQMVPLLAGFAILAAIIGAGFWLVEGRRDDAAATRSALEFDRKVIAVSTLIDDAESSQRGFLLTGDPKYLEPYRKAIAKLPALLDAIEVVPAQDGNATPAQKLTLHQAIDAKLAELKQTIDLAEKGDREGALAIVHTDRGRKLMDAVRSIIESLRLQQEDQLNQTLAQTEEKGRLLGVASVLAFLVLIILVALSVVANLRRFTEVVRANNDLADANKRLSQEIEQRQAVEAQVRQMQKMEAIGQLTGGIAHDFNNMLAVIMSAMNLLRRRLARGETDLDKFIDAAVDAATRAATLTSRLLAFSRQQPLSPSIVDMNRLVADMSEMLSRTLGEHVQLETVLAGGLWKTKADAGQLENAVLNLCVNARDAMPEGGKLTIETANCHLDDSYSLAHVEVSAGQYVQIAVTDTGEGMDGDVIARAFDPFFTTKPTGKGTGLGLSQVFGFVKQSGGHVKIYSEVGQGTTVKIYLPRNFGEDGVPVVAKSTDFPMGDSTVTILVVEDDDRVRVLTIETLRDLGYAVLDAANSQAALAVLKAHPAVTLLFTDIVMPGGSGRKLADEALALRPDLKVIFTTGFTRNAVVHNGILDHDVHFIAKPFTSEQLAQKIRDVLVR